MTVVAAAAAAAASGAHLQAVKNAILIARPVRGRRRTQLISFRGYSVPEMSYLNSPNQELFPLLCSTDVLHGNADKLIEASHKEYPLEVA